MKKQYSAPDIMFESFTLSTSIAGDCEKIIGNQVVYTCGVRFGTKVVFTGNATGCTTKVEDGSKDYNGWCYHIPVDNKEIFNS